MNDDMLHGNPGLEVADLLTDRFPGHTMQRLRTPEGKYRYLFVSSGVQGSFGLDPAELMRIEEADHSWVHPDDRQKFIDALEQSARDLTPLDAEVRVETPTDGYRWVRSLGQPRRQADGAVIWDGVALDVTDRREAQEALERTLRQARQDEASEGRFAYIAANDVQTCLADLRGAVASLGQAGPGRSVEAGIVEVKEQFRRFERALGAARDLVQAGDRSSGPADAISAASLTRRQREIMDRVADGASNRAISEALGISEGTVKLHMSAILKRLEVQNRTEAAHLWRTARPG